MSDESNDAARKKVGVPLMSMSPPIWTLGKMKMRLTQLANQTVAKMLSDLDSRLYNDFKDHPDASVMQIIHSRIKEFEIKMTDPFDVNKLTTLVAQQDQELTRAGINFSRAKEKLELAKEKTRGDVDLNKELELLMGVLPQLTEEQLRQVRAVETSAHDYKGREKAMQAAQIVDKDKENSEVGSTVKKPVVHKTKSSRNRR